MADSSYEIEQDKNIIKQKSLSFEQIISDLKEDALEKFGGQEWTDWLEGSTGQTIMRWLGALAVYLRYGLEMSRLENSLEFARHRKSIVEHAFNRGMALAPVQGWQATLSFSATGTVVIDTGDEVGTYGKYRVYSLESKTVTDEDSTLNVVVGQKTEFVKSIPGLSEFTEFRFVTPYPLVATSLEEFTIDGQEIELRSDVNYLSSISNDFLLRRVTEGEVLVYTGNGVLGWHDPNSTEVRYTTISYDQDLSENSGDSVVVNVAGMKKTDWATTAAPEYGLSNREIQRAAVYYPIDGRIITSLDYDAIILKHYGGKFLDVWSWNDDPNQHIELIADDSYSTSDLDDVKALIDSKRGLGIQVFYNILEKTAGVNVSVDFKVNELYYDTALVESIQAYLNSKRFLFMRQETVLTNIDWAVELTNETKVTIYPVGTQTYNLDATDFIKSVTLTLTGFSKP